MSEVTNERKVSILEKLLLERDEQIRKLQEENTELQKEIESFGSDIQVSTGSACNSGNPQASKALTTIGMDEEDIHSCIRITFSGKETKEELDIVNEQLKKCVSQLRDLCK